MDAVPQDRVADYRIDLTRLLYMFYMDQEQQLARADAKANLILTANSILLVVAVNMVVSRMRAMPDSVDILWLLAPLLPAALLSVLATHYALSVAYPRQGGSHKAPGMFESATVAEKSFDDYERSVMSAELNEIKREVLRGIHAKANILQVKFARVRLGIQCTVAAFVAWIAFMAATVVYT
ncbi:MAG TPA: Pycsar system effector family protein [Fontimonas sp.]